MPRKRKRSAYLSNKKKSSKHSKKFEINLSSRNNSILDREHNSAITSNDNIDNLINSSCSSNSNSSNNCDNSNVISTIDSETAISILSDNEEKHEEELRQNSISQISSQLRNVTADDYLVRALSMPPKYGIISKAITQKPTRKDKQEL